MMIERLKKLTNSTRVTSDLDISGFYDWYDENGKYIVSCEVNDSINWTMKKRSGEDVINIEVNLDELNQLIEKSTDPLLLINTGKVKAYYHEYPADSGIRKKIEILLNQMLTKQHSPISIARNIGLKSGHLRSLSGYLTLDNINALKPFLQLGLPAYIPMGIADWKIMALSKDEIVDFAGMDTEVSILIKEHDEKSGANAEYMSIRLSEYIEIVSDPERVSDVGYMAANSLPNKLLRYVTFPDVFPSESFNVPRWWIGAAGTGLKLHRDLIDNFLCQIKGKKKITLFSPLDSENLYPCSVGGNPLYEPSQFDVSNPNYELYPMAHYAKAVTCELAEGDLMYIPAGWWHAVENISESWSINYFAVNKDPCVLLN